MCYKVTSRVMEAAHRERFRMIRAEDAVREIGLLFDPPLLPAHLGGFSSSYTSTVNVEYHPPGEPVSKSEASHLLFFSFFDSMRSYERMCR